MVFYITFIKSLCVVFVIWFELVNCDTNCKKRYDAEFSDNVNSCKNYDNKYLDASGLKLTPLPGSKEGEDMVALSGGLCFLVEIPAIGVELQIKIYKHSERGDEMMTTFICDLCESLKDKNAPQYNATKQMGITECPIAKNCLELKDYLLKLDFASDFLNHQFVGTYTIELTILDGIEVIVCFVLRVSVSEVEVCDD